MILINIHFYTRLWIFQYDQCAVALNDKTFMGNKHDFKQKITF